jgi:PAS domain S-box-containing protein
MIEEYASLSNTEINFFSGATLSIGTLPFQSELAPLVPEQEVRCQDMLTTHQGITVIPITLKDQNYYQGQCTLNNGQESIGAITVNLSQEIEQQEIAKIVKAVSTISGVGILICVVLVSGVLVPKFTGPIITLTNAALRMAQGDLKQKIDTSGQDELGTLARSFAHMRDEIQQKIEELQHLNAELDQRVEERTAEVVRQKYILDTFMETVPDRIYFKDCQGRITRANKAHASRMGVLDPSQEIGKTDFDFFPYKDAQRRYEQEQEILRSGTPLIGMEEQRKWPDGHEEWSLVTKMPLRNEHGEIIGTFGVSRDITELKHTEDALRHAKNAAEAANRAKSEFLANMSHELRTPLNVILGLTQIMTRNPQFLKEERENLDIIHHSGEHLLMLINNVLDLSKIEAGRIPINEQGIDLFRLLDELKEMVAVKAAPKQLDLLFDYAEDVPQYVRLDAGKLRQVLINLLNNAVKFTEEGGVTVRVKKVFSNQDSVNSNQYSVSGEQCTTEHCLLNTENSLLSFEIEDSGPGIAPEEMTMLFEAFAQTQTGRNAQEGTGLGLAISQKFVQLLGGTIAVESELQRGTTFKFTIPVTLANASDVVSAAVTQRVIALQPDQPRYRILVVDDNPHNRRLLVKLLVPLGFDVREAENGQDGIRLWKEFEPHLIWMDLRMPGIDGYEAIRQIRKLEGQKAVIIIALTASSFEDEREHVLAAGCDDFLRKPFRETEIFDLLHTYLGIRYVYEEPLQSGNKKTDRAIGDLLTSASLATLPPDLYADLQQAVNVTDPGMMYQLLPKVREHDADLADALHQLVQEFRFDILQTLFEV